MADTVDIATGSPASGVARAQLGPAVDTWKYLRPWSLARDIASCTLVVLLLHEFIVRVLGQFFLPMLIGASITPFYWDESMTLALFALGLWRYNGDPVYRARLQQPFVRWLFICILFSTAFLSLHVTSITGLLGMRALLYAPYLFMASYLAGIDREKLYRTFLIIGVLNIIAIVLIELFFLNQYELMIAFFDRALPGFETLAHAARKAFSLPAGVIVYRLFFRSLFLIVGSVSLSRALHWSGKAIGRWLYAALAFISLLLVLGTYSRAGIFTLLLAYLLIIAHWFYARTSQGSAQERTRYAFTALGLLVGALIFTAGVFAVQQSLGVNMLDTTSLVDEQGGRFGNWAKVAENISRTGGWIAGTPTSARKSILAAFVDSSAGKELTWSELSYFAVDNQYISTIISGGIMALAGILGFFGIVMNELRRRQLILELAMITAAILIEANLESQSMSLALIMFLAGGQLSLGLKRPS